MAITLGEPGTDDLGGIDAALRDWQVEGAPVQLHPGDVGWFRRFGAVATAAALRTWTRGAQLVAVGLLDGPALVRMAIAPDAQHDGELASRIVDDVSDTGRGVLGAGRVAVESWSSEPVRTLLSQRGWQPDEPWTPLRRDLALPVSDVGLRVEVLGAGRPAWVADRVDVHRAAFAGSSFSAERWQAMAEALSYADARCLIGYDGHDVAVAAATVWSAGVGRPGLLEPVGVHRDHRGHGYGRAISQAAAAVLRELGSSSACVCTPSSNVAAVAAYASAGFERHPELRDRYRGA